MSRTVNPPPATTRCQRLLLTGAAGGLGQVLRPRLKPHTNILRVSDVAPLAPAEDGEETMLCDLADAAAVSSLVQGVDAIVHLGGVSVERPFEDILPANIQGVYNLYEAARVHGVRRVVFASSNHVIGFYEQGQQLDADVPLRPDGYYGLSKAYGEHLSRFYFDRYGIETVCLRIGSSFPAPKDRRMLVTWLSYDDLTDLVTRALFAPDVGHLIVYGASANRDSWWRDDAAKVLGFVPKDSSERFRAQVEAQPPLPADDPAARYQGGAFVKAGPFPFPTNTSK
ncbi:Cholesterol dehydrogenase [Achromobacter spanius]|uniref:NAD-dependent epimerase/dehydratase family protein n=1 Tax=Achromobacter spanius TaxID=217203 RepID=UPI000C2CAE2F|nr:NAD(P)-dependent oxidoreductase [Achromobacter spanius]AUA56481.1 NAD-dependent dehydratase [Achromobacter spanius]CAB3691755.1 Uronate dehydrogenase [Achromobacter spanius]VEE55940.1 Cholesterol dehydrogenase [Achromobacter spanius]